MKITLDWQFILYCLAALLFVGGIAASIWALLYLSITLYWCKLGDGWALFVSFTW